MLPYLGTLYSHSAIDRSVRCMCFTKSCVVLPWVVLFNHGVVLQAPGSSRYSIQTGVRLNYGSPPPARGQLPSTEEALPLLQNQTVLLQQLETENKFIKVSILYVLCVTSFLVQRAVAPHIHFDNFLLSLVMMKMYLTGGAVSVETKTERAARRESYAT